MCNQSNTVWVPTLADGVCNLMEEGAEDMLRYSITSGELQRTAASIISGVQAIEQDGCYFGENHTGEPVVRRAVQDLYGLLERLAREGKNASDLRMPS